MSDELQLEQGPAVPLQAKQGVKRVRHHVQSFQRNSKPYVRTTPTRAALTALGVRLILGLILRR